MLSGEVWFTVIITTLMILLLVAAIIITIVAANRRQTQQEVKYEKELRTTAHEVQEQVLGNVGRELHDNIGQLLTFMNMQLEQQQIMNPEAMPMLQSINVTLTHTIEEVRRVGRSLNSDLLGDNGLINTIKHETERLRQLGRYSVHWVHDDEPLLTGDQKVIVFRIFQEALNNILKHSGAANIYINLAGKDGFKMLIKDDGKGFDLDEMMRSEKGSGLKNMIRRAELGKLKCNITTATGKGATFTLELMA